MRKGPGIVFTSILLLLIVPMYLLQGVGKKRSEVPQAGRVHRGLTPDKIVWTVSRILPAGFQVAVIDGDPSKEGALYTVRVRGIDGRFAPHWHPSDEYATVIQGTYLVGTGEKFDKAALQALPAGSYVSMPKEMRHFGQFKGDTIVQIHGVGPFKKIYVDPADDPSLKTSQK
jgi:quercetin dioxygenase-like cupin family protein